MRDAGELVRELGGDLCKVAGIPHGASNAQHRRACAVDFIVQRGPIDDDNILDCHADSLGLQDLESIMPRTMPKINGQGRPALIRTAPARLVRLTPGQYPRSPTDAVAH